METDRRRLFFGLEVKAPWPDSLPDGRHLTELNRHMTLAFLGEVNFAELESLLPSCPQPSFKVGLGGFFDQCLILPPRHPNVVAWHVKWLEDVQTLLTFRDQLNQWLLTNQFPVSHPERDFLPHVTLCRRPFKEQEWKQAFISLPLFVASLHLYQSLGHCRYQSIWYYPILSPFEEIEHTADIAFHIKGINIQQLHQHAQLALSFKDPRLLSYLSEVNTDASLEDVIMTLNETIAKMDAEIGCSFKAISFHDDLTEENGILTWEMIVDV